MTGPPAAAGRGRRALVGHIGPALPVSPVAALPTALPTALPRLDGVPVRATLRREDGDAARVAASVLRTGIAHATEWAALADTDDAGSPAAFLTRVLDRFVAEREGADLAADLMGLHVRLVSGDALVGDSSSYCPASTRAAAAAAYYFCVSESSPVALPVFLGPTLAALEAAHPRLPATFYRLFADALGSWLRLYDHGDAAMYREMREDEYDMAVADAREAGEEPPPRPATIADAVPASLARRPLDDRSLARLLDRLDAPGGPHQAAARWVRDALALRRAAVAVPAPMYPDAFHHAMWSDPLPPLLIAFHPDDAISAAFDEEYEFAYEVQRAPALLIPLPLRADGVSDHDDHATLDARVALAFRQFGTAVAVYRDALALVRRLPDAMPEYLGDEEGGVAAGPVAA